ncbi:MAG: Arm DNA-binding domain-containing protein, partial [Azoarcus sp.]|nr:Arm DNA-binding domain-containing protein [Azoarcus sp.]
MPGIEKLTHREIACFSKPGKYSDGGGLYLQITKNLSKSWVFRYQINGVEHYKGLGSLHSVGLNQARKLARRARASLAAEA